jgi:hypothetical protein
MGGWGGLMFSYNQFFFFFNFNNQILYWSRGVENLQMILLNDSVTMIGIARKDKLVKIPFNQSSIDKLKNI